MARVRKPDGEQTFAGSRGNDEVAPIRDLPAVTPETGWFDPGGERKGRRLTEFQPVVYVASLLAG